MPEIFTRITAFSTARSVSGPRGPLVELRSRGPEEPWGDRVQGDRIPTEHCAHAAPCVAVAESAFDRDMPLACEEVVASEHDEALASAASGVGWACAEAEGVDAAEPRVLGAAEVRLAACW